MKEHILHVYQFNLNYATTSANSPPGDASKVFHHSPKDDNVTKTWNRR